MLSVILTCKLGFGWPEVASLKLILTVHVDPPGVNGCDLVRHGHSPVRLKFLERVNSHFL